VSWAGTELVILTRTRAPAVILETHNVHALDSHHRSIARPDELGAAWHDGKVHLPMLCHWNGRKVGEALAGEDMVFDFHQLLAHAVKTRNARAGSIVGSGTVSNKNPSRGWSCIAEVRALEMIESGAAQTAFMAFGDTIRIEMIGSDGQSVFGAIDQKVVRQS
jgi:fumarylacetoacetate (FAA) hydrolase